MVYSCEATETKTAVGIPASCHSREIKDSNGSRGKAALSLSAGRANTEEARRKLPVRVVWRKEDFSLVLKTAHFHQHLNVARGAGSQCFLLLFICVISNSCPPGSREANCYALRESFILAKKSCVGKFKQQHFTTAPMSSSLGRW